MSVISLLLPGVRSYWLSLPFVKTRIGSRTGNKTEVTDLTDVTDLGPLKGLWPRIPKGRFYPFELALSSMRVGRNQSPCNRPTGRGRQSTRISVLMSLYSIATLQQSWSSPLRTLEF
jgi:hypothetical protein